MKKLICICILPGLAALAPSCWTEVIPEAGAPRHQVESLAAIPGDEEVQLSWSMPEGWDPTDYIVFYTDADSQTVTMKTGKTNTYVVGNLTNGTTYNFNVQAVYGTLVSNAVVVSGTPATSRIPVARLDAQAGDAYVKLLWTTPSTTLLSYTLSYYNEETPDDVQSVEIPKEDTEYLVEGLANDKNYYFSLTADYEKGPSEAVRVRAMPTKAVPYFLSTSSAAQNQPVTFTFNSEAYPTASDVKWTFPDGTVLTGTNVLSGFASTGTQTVVLSATIDGYERKWNIEVEIREYVIFYNQWLQDGTAYNGFRYSCPVFSPDGKTVYVVTFNKIMALYAFDTQSGELKWTYQPQDNATANILPAVNPVTGVIYYGTTAGHFYAVNSDGSLKWEFTGAGSMESAPPAVSADGAEIYICDAAGTAFAIESESGRQKWSISTGPKKGAGMLINGNRLIVGTVGGIYVLSTDDGSIVKSHTRVLLQHTGFAVSPDKTTAYFSSGATICGLNLADYELGAETLTERGNFYTPVVAPNGTVFAGSKNGWACCFSADLQTEKWAKEHTPGTNGYNFSRPCVDTENRFYITGGGNNQGSTNYIFDANGTIVSQWSVPDPSGTTDGNNAQYVQNGNNLLDGVLYTAYYGKGNYNGLFVGKYVGGQRAEGWASHGGDICGSCCIK